MEAQDLIKIKRSLLACADGNEEIAENLHKWLNTHIQEFGNSRSYEKSDMIRFKTVEQFTEYRRNNLIKMHLQIAEMINSKGMSFIESRPLPGDRLEDRIRILVLGLPNGG